MVGKEILTGAFDEQFITHTKQPNLIPPPIPATSSWINQNLGVALYENWSRATLIDEVVYGIDFDQPGYCIPCFENILEPDNLIYNKNYLNNLLYSNIRQHQVPTSSAVRNDNSPCQVPQAPFLYGVPSLFSSAARQRTIASRTGQTDGKIPIIISEVSSSC